MSITPAPIAVASYNNFFSIHAISIRINSLLLLQENPVNKNNIVSQDVDVTVQLMY